MTDQNGQDFTTLIEQAKGGSNEAKNALIESVRTYLQFIANQEIDARLQQKVAASDVVQDVCLVASERLETFRGSTEGEFKAWLKTVLKNSLADSHRKYVQSQKRAAGREVVMGDELGIPASNISPGTSMIAREESARLLDAMQRLPDDYRQVLRLRNWDLLPFDDIGRRMDRSADAAQKLWTRAVRRLEQELDLE